MQIWARRLNTYLLLQQIFLVLLIIPTLASLELLNAFRLLLKLAVVGSFLLNQADDRGSNDLKLGTRHCD